MRRWLILVSVSWGNYQQGLSWNDHKQCDSDAYDISGQFFVA
ncbi:MAG: hypothetical protein ACLU80_00275 [Dorea sp.]